MELYVSKLGDDTDGRSWATAFRTVQQALSAVPDDGGGHTIAVRPVMTLDEAIQRVGALVGAAIDWTRLEAFLPAGLDNAKAKSALASSFVAALELARQGRLEIQQDGIFQPIFLRAGVPDMEAGA